MLFEEGALFNDSIEHTKAALLVHAIKRSPGGYKLSFELTLWLASNFEDAYLPGNAQSMAALFHEVSLDYERHKVNEWYLREQKSLSRPPKTRWQRIKELIWRSATHF